ncbi:MAG: Glu/Leu/Phe/Val dehydrogenase family protein, partial [Patescibacteria group bacterium]
PFFIGKSDHAGDPSPFAALSTFLTMQAACRHRFGSDDMSNRTVAVKGVGKVGGELVRLLHGAGAKKIFIADIKQSAVDLVHAAFPGVIAVSASDIHRTPVDIFAPCALGYECTRETLPEFRCAIMCGGANNQMSSSDIATALHAQGIVYVPDFLANAGGLIDVADELEDGGYRRDRVLERIQALSTRLEEILAMSKARNLPPYLIAKEFVQAYAL